MLYRFPPAPAQADDPSFLTCKSEVFAKLKIESAPGKRTVLMTEHTLIFVLKGKKLLHFPGETRGASPRETRGDSSRGARGGSSRDGTGVSSRDARGGSPEGTLSVSPGEVILLQKGIYVMAEYIEEGLDFGAMMLFLPLKILRELAAEGRKGKALAAEGRNGHCLVLPVNGLINGFKEGFRRYFENPPVNFEVLLPLKQKEILLLLMAGPHGEEVRKFIHTAVSAESADIDYVVKSYLLQPVTVAELASLANCSLAKFKRDFRERYHCSPRVWINGQRIRHAKMLLENTSKTVGEIALECRFENVSYFIRLFKREYGGTPVEIRGKAATGRGMGVG